MPARCKLFGLRLFRGGHTWIDIKFCPCTQFFRILLRLSRPWQSLLSAFASLSPSRCLSVPTVMSLAYYLTTTSTRVLFPTSVYCVPARSLILPTIIPFPSLNIITTSPDGSSCYLLFRGLILSIILLDSTTKSLVGYLHSSDWTDLHVWPCRLKFEL
jgi:hypothetical protein